MDTQHAGCNLEPVALRDGTDLDGPRLTLAEGQEGRDSDQDRQQRLPEIPNFGHVKPVDFTDGPDDDHARLTLAQGQEGRASDEERQQTLAEIPNLGQPETTEVEKPEEPEARSIQHVDENKFVIVSIIIPMAILGTLIRIGVQQLQTYDGAPVFGLVYAQWIGCFIMGIVVQAKAELIRCYLPLQIGLSTGLCGSITTFSSWQRDVFMAFANYDGSPHDRGYNALAGLSQILVTLAMSLNGLVFGHHVGRWLLAFYRFTCNPKPKKYPISVEIVPRGYNISSLSLPDWALVAFAWSSWVGVVIAAILTKRQQELALACVWAPVGALSRWQLSTFNVRRKNQGFMWGTFAANMLGTLILAILTLLESGVTMTYVSCNVILGLADGLCGCLTTISTFVVELSSLPLRRSYIYGTVSVILGQCFMFVILGTYIWSQGINRTC